LQNFDPRRFDYFLKLFFSKFLWAQIGFKILKKIKKMGLHLKALDWNSPANGGEPG